MTKNNKRSGWFGFSESSEFLKFTFDELVSHVTGMLIVSIGQGKFRDEVYQQVRIICAWAQYNDKGM